MADPAIPRTLDVALVLELEVLPIAGSVQAQPTQPQRFDGWLELIAAIESSLNAARSDPRPPEPGGRP